jgi:hypothetical protein
MSSLEQKASMKKWICMSFLALIGLEQKKLIFFRPTLGFRVSLLALTGHLGGTLVHGTD